MIALHVSAALCSCISLLCLLIALATEYWVRVADSSEHSGLWKNCNQHECFPFGVELVPAFLNATRTFMILGMIAGVVSLSGLCIMNYQHSLSKISMTRITYIASFTAGLCVMIAMSIYTKKIHQPVVPTRFVIPDIQYQWSFGMGWASFPLYLVTGCLIYLLHKRTATAA